MYNITNELLEQLKASLHLNNIPIDKYSDDELMAVLSQAVTLIGASYVEGEVTSEYMPDFEGDTYITISYPILTDEVVCTVDGVVREDIVKSVSSTGIIRFQSDLSGDLEVTYTQGLPMDTINQYLVLVAVQILGKLNGTGTVSNINEGDVSVGYDTSGTTRGSLDSLIMDVHNLFGARVRML